MRIAPINYDVYDKVDRFQLTKLIGSKDPFKKTDKVTHVTINKKRFSDEDMISLTGFCHGQPLEHHGGNAAVSAKDFDHFRAVVAHALKEIQVLYHKHISFGYLFSLYRLFLRKKQTKFFPWKLWELKRTSVDSEKKKRKTMCL